MQQYDKCPNCGAELGFGVAFCGTCGTQLKQQTQQNNQQVKAPHRNIKIQGVNGRLELQVNTVKISRKGLLSFLTQEGKKEISLSQISTIRFKKAGALAHGYIQISYLDENTIMFNANQEQSFALIKDEIEKRMEQSKQDTKRGSNLHDLEKLASLRDKGIITNEEFNIKKRQILGM